MKEKDMKSIEERIRRSSSGPMTVTSTSEGSCYIVANIKTDEVIAKFYGEDAHDDAWGFVLNMENVPELIASVRMLRSIIGEKT